MKSSHRKSAVEVFAIPALIFMLSVGGLIAALAVDGPADFFATLAAATPLAILSALALRAPRRGRSRR